MKIRPFRTLRGKIIVSLVALIVLPVVWIMYRYYDSSARIIETQIYRSNQTALERKALTMDELLTRTAKASNLILGDPNTLLFLRDTTDWTSDYSGFSSYKELFLMLNNVRDLLLDGNAYLALYDFKGHIHTTWAGSKTLPGSELEREPWYAGTIELSGLPTWTLPYAIPAAAGNQPLLVMTRLLKSEWQSGDGMLLIALPAGEFFFSEQELDAQRQSGVHTLLVQNGTALFGDTTVLGAGDKLQAAVKDDNGISRLKLDGKPYLVNQARLTGTGWTLVQLTESSAFSAQLSQAKNRSISFMVIWFALFTVAFIGLMFRFTQPIKTLIQSMNLVGRGDLSIEVAVRGRDEIAWLGIRFNRMVQQLNQLIARLSAEQQRKEKAQFQALQAQINPHFLLNTMNSIKWMALLSGASHVSEMLTKLGRLLNYTMRQHEAIVTIREELDYLHVYLALQEIRYHDQIQLETAVPDELLDCEIVKFTLQPIVENSIMHGNRFPLHIRIDGQTTAADETLLLRIIDNGVGMSEAAVRQVEERMTEPHAKYSGLGMRNVHDRLRLEYGGDYGIAMESAPEQGVTVTIRIPLRRREREDATLDRG